MFQSRTPSKISTVFFDVQEFKVKQFFLSRLSSDYAHHYGLFLCVQFFFTNIVHKKPTFSIFLKKPLHCFSEGST